MFVFLLFLCTMFIFLLFLFTMFIFLLFLFSMFIFLFYLQCLFSFIFIYNGYFYCIFIYNVYFSFIFIYNVYFSFIYIFHVSSVPCKFVFVFMPYFIGDIIKKKSELECSEKKDIKPQTFCILCCAEIHLNYISESKSCRMSQNF